MECPWSAIEMLAYPDLKYSFQYIFPINFEFILMPRLMSASNGRASAIMAQDEDFYFQSSSLANKRDQFVYSQTAKLRSVSYRGKVNTMVYHFQPNKTTWE